MPTYPLKVSSNGRYLVDQTNTPVLLVGESAYSLISQLSSADVSVYLANRSEKGFNFLWVTLIDGLFCTNPPANLNGDQPFSSTVFTTPNETYFAHADAVITACANVGMTVLLSPLYLGNPSNQGWGTQVAAASTGDMASWGTFCGNRYKNSPNIVWLIGGDIDPTSVASKVTAFVNALIAADPNHVVTAHNTRGQMAVDPWSGAAWLTCNTTYSTYLNTVSQAQSAYTYSTRMPFFQVEAYYENEHSVTKLGLRSQMYWTVLSGGCGHVFGNDPMWGFSYSGISSFADGGTDLVWQDNLDTLGAFGMGHAGDILSRRPWWNLIPDSSNTVATSGFGTLGTSNYVTTARAPDGTSAISYLPTTGGITFDMTKFSAPVFARWYDPTNGASQMIGGSPFANTSTRTFTPTGNNHDGDADWVLLLDAAVHGTAGRQ